MWPFKKTEKRDASNDLSWSRMLGINPTSTGQHVDVKRAEGISAVYACVQALSESTACLPLHVYARDEHGDRSRADDHYLSRLLREPNSYQSGFSFRECMTASVLLWGNAYAIKEINGNGEVTALHPVNPQLVNVIRLASGRYAYEVNDERGGINRYLDDEIFHLRDRCEAGSIVGKSRVTLHRETLGLSLALQEHGATTFRNGVRLAGVFQWNKTPSTEKQIAVKESFDAIKDGVKAGKTVMSLPPDVEWKPMNMSLEDQQWIESMGFNVAEVCRIFRVPPILVQELEHATFTNVIELGQQFVRFSLQRWLTMWETEISRSLLGAIGRRRYMAEHSVEGLLRGNPEARADFYGKAIDDGWLLVDEVRKLENLPALHETNSNNGQ